MAVHTYRLVITGTIASQFYQNVLHYQFEDGAFGSTEAAALSLINAWDGANINPYRSLLSTSVSIMSLKSRALNSTGGFEAFKPYTPFVHGSLPGTLQVSGTGPCVVLLPINNDKHRGRVFLPGIPDPDVTDGILSVGYNGVFNLAGHIFTDPLVLVGGGAPTAVPVIYSKGPPAISRRVAFAKLSPMVATQRRRQKPV